MLLGKTRSVWPVDILASSWRKSLCCRLVVDLIKLMMAATHSIVCFKVTLSWEHKTLRKIWVDDMIIAAGNKTS